MTGAGSGRLVGRSGVGAVVDWVVGVGVGCGVAVTVTVAAGLGGTLACELGCWVLSVPREVATHSPASATRVRIERTRRAWHREAFKACGSPFDAGPGPDHPVGMDTLPLHRL